MNMIEENPLQILPLGTSDAFCLTDYHTSALLRGGSTLCLIDCPEPIHKIIYERTTSAGLDITARDVQHLLLTHLHGDHAGGIESFLFMRKFICPESPRPILHCLPEVAERLWPDKLACSMEHSEIKEIQLKQHFKPEDYYELRIIEPGQPFMAGDIEFTARRALHSVPTFGFTASYGGRTLGYSGDTIFDTKHIDFLAKADLIFHDCNESVIHTQYQRLLELDSKIKEKMRIFHMAEKFDRHHSQIEPVQPGRLYTV